MMKYKDENEIREIVRSFEAATIGREKWGHAEHLTVALVYLSEQDIATATAKMRSGIFNLLTSGFGIDLAKEMPYHETLTVFWMRTIEKFQNENTGRDLLSMTNDLICNHDKNFPLKFYSRELLFSENARENFVDSDLK